MLLQIRLHACRQIYYNLMIVQNFFNYLFFFFLVTHCVNEIYAHVHWPYIECKIIYACVFLIQKKKHYETSSHEKICFPSARHATKMYFQFYVYFKIMLFIYRFEWKKKLHMTEARVPRTMA